MPKFIDMAGQVIGKLTVLSRVKATGQARWLCHCECGKQTIQTGYDLRAGLIISCGCSKSERIAMLNKTHGKTGTKEYMVWRNMLNRCYRAKNPDFARYGAIGVKVCDRWKDDFSAFLEDMGECPEFYSLDRIDNERGYSKDNCRWAHPEVQANNKRRIKLATLNGVTKSIAQWCRELGLSHRTVRARVYSYGWEPERALTTPIKS